MENSLINKLVCTFFLILVAASGLQAEPLSITATVSRTRLAVNQQLALTIELSGDGAQRAEQPELPDMGGYLTFLGSGGTSQNMSFVNGKMSVSKSFTFYYLAAKAGTFTIPPIKVVHKNKTIQSQPITLTITPSSTPPSPDRQKQGRTDNKNSENLYIRTLVNKKTVFQNEPIVVTYRIYAAVSVTGYSIIKLPETTGFWVEDIEMPPQPEVKEEIINGQRYVTADIKKMTLFPTSPGKRSIGPLSLQCEVKEQTRRRSRDIFDSFFDDGFFGRTVRKTISSPIAEINVKPLPRIDKPDSFSGVVGQFKITASVDKNTVKTDEAVTLTVTLSGVGNIRTLSEPVVQIPPDFEQYEPTISEKIDRTNGVISGSKTFEYVLVPRFPGMQRIKPIEFSYFDPKTKSYKIVRSPELLINVEKGAGQIVRSGGSGLSKEEIKYVGQDIRFIKLVSDDFRPIGDRLYKRDLFFVLLVFPLLLLGIAFSYQKHVEKLSGNIAYARSRKANAMAKKRLSKAKTFLKPDMQKEFFAEVSNALTGFAADKLNLSRAGLISDELEKEFSKRGVSNELTKEYFDLVRMCDFQRFAPATVNAEEMTNSYATAKKLIIKLDKAL